MKPLPTLPLRVPAHVHLLPDRAVRLGWRICAAADAGDRLGAERRDQAMRIVLHDLPSPGTPTGPRGPVVTVAEAVAAGLPSSRGVPPAAPRRSTITTRNGQGRTPGVTVFDLFPGGEVVVACRDSPSLLRIGPDGGVGLLPPIPGSGPDEAVLAPGERLLVFTPELLQAIPPQSLVDLTEAARSGVDSCELWRRCTAATGGGQVGPGMIVVTREADPPDGF